MLGKKLEKHYGERGQQQIKTNLKKKRCLGKVRESNGDKNQHRLS